MTIVIYVPVKKVMLYEIQSVVHQIVKIKDLI